MKDIKARILSNKEIAPGYFKMALDAPYIAKTAKPGQFVQVRCSDGFDPLLRRPLSIHRLKAQGSPRLRSGQARLKGIEILYEVVGKGTKILSEKKDGNLVDILGPLGNGFTLPTALNLEPSAILVAGGIGVAPLVFLAEELAKKKIDTVVFIGARTKKFILCAKDFKKLGAGLQIATDDGSRGYKGFVSRLLKLRAGTKVYACGPRPMLECIAGMCIKENVECEVSLEEKMACGMGACLGCAVKVAGNEYKLACKDGPVFSANKIIWLR
ncbi:MAG: dihydroorotate dehydrogenase electron transfer subunit [Candidatus Omnitrophica bacterium]|nr:dihydroorotate dehydrogenase electron transfer subunit [Candidatus Omnitrophota bacterium]MBU1932575.1 dihydroorotate dehydrogenase electron transfer subunit [Candidatus Omnitrophota bacterium]